MAGDKTVKSIWCFLRSNEVLRTAIKYKQAGLDLNLKELAHAAGVDYTRLCKWFKNRAGALSQYEVIRLCTYLGIEVELTIKFTNG